MPTVLHQPHKYPWHPILHSFQAHIANMIGVDFWRPLPLYTDFAPLGVENDI